MGELAKVYYGIKGDFVEKMSKLYCDRAVLSIRQKRMMPDFLTDTGNAGRRRRDSLILTLTSL